MLFSGSESVAMLEVLDHYDGSDAARKKVCQAFDQRLVQLSSATQRADRTQVSRLEEAVERDPKGAFSFDANGLAQLENLQAGRFSCPSLRQLSQRLDGLPQGQPGRLRLWVLEGSSAVTDIGALQAAAPPRSLFQVASQYNCLEAPDAYLVPVRRYFSDPTQGPRASISAFPGTLLRHYAAPGADGSRFVQRSGGPQVNLLHRVCLDKLARVENGYLLSSNIQDAGTFATLLQDHFEDLEVGLQEEVQVVLGANWDGLVEGRRTIAQVLTSTLAGGGYSRIDLSKDHWVRICRQLQRAAYLGTLLAAAGLGQQRVVLTLIGGGVFGNPVALIWDAILWASSQVGPRLRRDLTVIVNGRSLSHSLQVEPLRSAAQARGGDLLFCSTRGASFESP
jgi:hypothetical protein